MKYNKIFKKAKTIQYFYPGNVILNRMLEQGIVGLRPEDMMNSLSNRLISFIKKRVNSLDDAEDIAQDIFSIFVEGNLAETGENINTLLSRKRYAVLYLRERLKELYKEMIENER